MSTIYGVYASDIERSPLIKAFLTRGAADAFKKKCDDHEAKRPESPPGFTDPLNITDQEEAIFDAWDLKHKKWARRHPALGFDYYDCFHVDKIKLVER